MADPYIANVVLLTHLDINPPVDAMGRHTLTLNGSATIQNTNAKFGFALNCPGSAAADRVTTPIDSDFSFAASPFTVECWARVVGSGTQNILSIGDTGFEVVTIIFNGTTLGFRGGARLVGNSFIGANTFVTTRNAWVHLVVERPVAGANAVYFYVDGTRFNGSTGDANALQTPTGSVHIGGDNVSWTLNGQVDEVRITKGVARYAGAASITPPASPFDDPVAATTARPVINVVL